MIIHIDMHSNVPLYRQLKTAIVQGILSENLKEGDRLPSVRQLGCDLGINLHTVNKVYDLLRAEGYIRMHRGVGAVVCTPPPADSGDRSRFADRLLPLVVEMRARHMTRAQIEDLLDEVWEQSLLGGGEE